MTPNAFRKIVDRTTTQISAALDKMVADLPEDVASQAAFEGVVKDLATRQPGFMRLMMEDADIREAYFEMVALMPLSARKDL